MPRLLRLLAPVLLPGLAGCGLLAPYGAAPAATPGVTATTVAVCYNRLGASAKDVEATAAQDCGPKTRLKLIEQEWNMSACPVLTPIRATFACEPTEATEPVK